MITKRKNFKFEENDIVFIKWHGSEVFYIGQIDYDRRELIVISGDGDIDMRIPFDDVLHLYKEVHDS